MHIISNLYKGATLQQLADNMTNQIAESFSQNSSIVVKTTNTPSKNTPVVIVRSISLHLLDVISRPIWSCHQSSVLVLMQFLPPAPFEIRWLCAAFRLK